MTKRYSVEQVAGMLVSDMSSIRNALEVLRDRHELSAETFLFADRSWRITPSDVQKVQSYLEQVQDQKSGEKSVTERRIRRVVKHHVTQPADQDGQS